MAQPELRLDENAPGPLYVDSTCIDCDTCRSVAPSVFARSAGAGKSYVSGQPDSPAEATRAAIALIACPTSSIGGASAEVVREAQDCLPEPVEDGVYYCGYASEKSFGASSYFVAGERGNVLVDSPRSAGPLIRNLEKLGGVERMLLTHSDDVADHTRFREHFQCERVIHGLEAHGGLRAVELQLEGDEPIELGPEWLAIPVPGHTRGSTAFLYRETFLFTGDHLWWSPTIGGLNASQAYCWWNWERQVESLRRLLDYRFEWILPGHGRRHRAESPKAMRDEIESLLARLTE
jgi:glyoxylase-like metal-dependent hydrolase (beta-lactamase superfamily II)/ferredoxin